MGVEHPVDRAVAAAQSALLPFDELERGHEDARHVFKVRTDVVRSRRSGRTLNVDRLAAPSWVHVVAIDRRGPPALVLVRQWRFGIRAFSLELPAGIVDVDEAPRTAALRELAEETGYTPAAGAGVKALGASWPNPAFMENELFTFVVDDARPTQAVAFDENEEIETVLLPLTALDAAIRDGTLRSVPTLAALLTWRAFDGAQRDDHAT